MGRTIIGTAVVAVVIDLSYGKGWTDALAAKEKMASGLDVGLNQVFLTPDKSSTRRHMLFVADRNPLAVPVGRSDLRIASRGMSGGLVAASFRARPRSSSLVYGP
jgi:hypothetical protein